MWTRKELKTRGREAMKRNYWKSVLAAMVLSLIMGGSYAGNFSNGFSNGFNSGMNSGSVSPSVEMTNPGIMDVNPFSGLAIAIFVASFLTMFLVLFAIGCVIDIFVVNPIELGVARFFYKNQQKNADARELFFGFDHGYKNLVNILFFRDLYITLWSLLFVIPGIVKAYEYRMVPYLLAENPEMDKQTAFAKSKEMMQGQKWRAFVLDLSFLGWDILGAFTMGVVSIFFVAPYKANTKAALYEALKMNSIGVE